MKIIGVLIVINALVLGGLLARNGQVNKWFFLLVALAVFVGVVFVLEERVTEVGIKGIGTIKAAARRAEDDANAISEIRKQVQQQEASIDSVAERAAEADSKLAKLDEALEMTRLVIAAKNDDRRAFEILGDYTNEKTSPYWRLAASVHVDVRAQFDGPIEPGYLSIPPQFNVKSIPESKVVDYYRSCDAFFHPALVVAFTDRADLSLRSRLELAASVLESDESLTATHYAGKFLADHAGIKWQPFNTAPLLAWWDSNRDSISDE